MYYFLDNTWEILTPHSHVAPCVRSGHSSVVHGDSLVVFGGKNDVHNKLNDLWVFDFNARIWTEVVWEAGGTIPKTRSGHSAAMYKGTMIIFGGIHEVT